MVTKDKSQSKWLIIVIIAVVFISIIVYHFSNTPSTIKANTGEAVVRFSNTPAATRADVLKADTYSSALEPRQRELVGLKGIQVCVSELNPNEESYGLSKRRLQLDVELRLRQNGIKVLSQKKWMTTPGTPTLWIKVSHQTAVWKDLSKADVSAVHITVELFEWVRLERDFQIGCFAAVWSQSLTNAIPNEDFADMVRQGVSLAIDLFINDYLAANPKEPAKENWREKDPVISP